jgi:hypothetical protein
MTELLRVALRAIGVVLPGAALWGFVAVTRGVSSDDGDIGALWLSWLAAAVWAAIDTSRAPASGVLVRWVAVAVVVGGGLGIAITLFAPGPPSQRTSDVVYPSLFFCVPLLAAVGLGVVIGMVIAAARARFHRPSL